MKVLLVLAMLVRVCLAGIGLGNSLRDSKIDMQERTYHEHYFQVSVNPNDFVSYILRDKVVLFPLTKTCSRPNAVKRRAVAYNIGTKQKEHEDDSGAPDKRWNPFISVYHYQLGGSLEDWKLEQENRNITETDWTETVALGFMLFTYLFYVSICATILPFVGLIFFHVSFRAWHIFTHRKIRNIFRRIWMSNERRKLQQNAFLRELDPKGRTKKKYRPVCPHWMRLYDREETPKELYEPSTESSDGESSDGFETAYVKESETNEILAKHPQKVNLKKKDEEEKKPDPTHSTKPVKPPKKKFVKRKPKGIGHYHPAYYHPATIKPSTYRSDRNHVTSHPHFLSRHHTTLRYLPRKPLPVKKFKDMKVGSDVPPFKTHDKGTNTRDKKRKSTKTKTKTKDKKV